MRRLFAEWLWRTTIIVALGWIGWELHQIHDALLVPLDDTATQTASVGVGAHDSIDVLSDDVAVLAAKIDAIMVAMLQLAR